MDKLIKEAREFVQSQVMPVVHQNPTRFQRTPDQYGFKVGFETGERVKGKEIVVAVREQLRIEKRVSLYAHMPVCSRRCRYCHYPVVVGGDVGRFVEGLMREANLLLEQVPEVRDKMVTSLYIGGGTPTLMSIAQIQKLLRYFREHFRLVDNVEITFEGSPEGWTPEKVECAKLAGVTRASVGVQVLDDVYLKWLGRQDTVAQAIDTVKRLISADFRSVNVDLIYGFPRQSVEKFAEDVQSVATLRPTNITLYRLRLGRGDLNSQLSRYYQQHPDEFPSQVETYVMQIVGRRILEHSGYVEGPIGWYSKPGFQPRVYQDRWIEQVSLIGFGWCAYSYGKTYEYHNAESISRYFAALDQGQLPIEHGWLYNQKEQQSRQFVFRRKALVKELNEVEKVLVEEEI
ncbi:MAG: hypothetical protein A2445_02520 [Candidatus Jacksonbacteria bacterium RIFOXYC2_FULL_44_29]|nr:MAG: hypothetical protein A2295_01730 [Candidatus Jacksonbacteria bacterium RIFOXYB2_FULL_44_15]OGY80749.1 MAG: hypothetical protein A2445_02520 [Candidatus Jacksonbacteria bacterium RIFOXYC2_FULL_44_29]